MISTRPPRTTNKLLSGDAAPGSNLISDTHHASLLSGNGPLRASIGSRNRWRSSRRDANTGDAENRLVGALSRFFERLPDRLGRRSRKKLTTTGPEEAFAADVVNPQRVDKSSRADNLERRATRQRTAGRPRKSLTRTSWRCVKAGRKLSTGVGGPVFSRRRHVGDEAFSRGHARACTTVALDDDLATSGSPVPWHALHSSDAN
jgi:hypothetical protein